MSKRLTPLGHLFLNGTGAILTSTAFQHDGSDDLVMQGLVADREERHQESEA